MKASPLLLTLAALSPACSFLSPELSLGTPRFTERTSGAARAGTDSSLLQGAPDTLFYISAVSFPRDYDWQKDSAFGAVNCTLKFYRGQEKLLSVPAGPAQKISAHPDKHHIIETSLFTEYCDSYGTTVKRDGELLASWPEPEFLQGICMKDGALYTIGRGVGTKGFSCRRNGEVLMKIDNGSVFGGFDKDTYGATGALYQDGGALYFAYKTEGGGMCTAYLVKDGVPEMLFSKPALDIFDIKISGGRTGAFYSENGVPVFSFGGKQVNVRAAGSVLWDDGEILQLGGEPCVVGHFRRKANAPRGFGLGREGTVSYLYDGSDFFYFDASGGEFLSFNQPGRGWEDYYFFNRHCASFIGGELAAVLTPRVRGSGAMMVYRSDTLKYELHGFLSGIAVEIDD